MLSFTSGLCSILYVFLFCYLSLHKLNILPLVLYSDPEPPDITNWFSSYVYESPELDSSDFDFSLSNRCTFGNNDKGKESSETKVKDELLSCSETIARDSEIKNKNPPTLQVCYLSQCQFLIEL